MFAQDGVECDDLNRSFYGMQSLCRVD